MRKWASCWMVSVLGIGALALPAMAFVPRSGNKVVVSEALQDDLYAAGGTVSASGSVDGDVVAAGGNVDLTGDVSGGVLAAGGSLTVSGAIGRSIRAAAGTLTLASRIKSDAVLAGGLVRVTPAAKIGRDLVVVGGSIDVSGAVGRDLVVGGGRNVAVSGTVGRDVLVGAGDVVIDGAIHGNAEIRANRIVLLPTARIDGVLRYFATQSLESQPGAQVIGGRQQLPAPAPPGWVRAAPFGAGAQFWKAFAEAIVLLVLGLVAFAVSPRGVSTVVLEIRQRFGHSLLIGFVLMVAVPAAAVLLLFTIAGIPLSLIAILLYLATLYPGLTITAAWVGHGILSLFRMGRGERPPDRWALLLGVIVLVALFTIPYAGWTLRLVAMFLGFGALWSTIYRGA